MSQRLSKLSREMEIKVGDVYIRNSDGQICRVRWLDCTTVVLELEDESRLRLTTIYGLEKTYSKAKPKPTQ